MDFISDSEAALIGGAITGVVGLILFAFQRIAEKRAKEVSQARFGYELIDAIFFKEKETYKILNYLDENDRHLIELRNSLQMALDETTLQGHYGGIINQFDTLLLFLDRLSHAITSELTTLDVIFMPLAYYVRLLAKEKTIINKYIDKLGYTRVPVLLNLFDAWKNAKG